MAEHPIQWLNMPGYKGETLNPIRAKSSGPGGTFTGWHCEKCQKGCEKCYAQKMNVSARFRGTGLPYTRTNRDKVKHFLDCKTLEKPLHWKKPRMIFWCDMTDLFGEWVPDKWIDDCIGVMSMTQQHIHCLLTKRPKRMAKYMRTWWPEYLEHIWLGTSVSTQADANKNIPELLKCPAAVRFVSFEPLLEKVDASPWLGDCWCYCSGCEEWSRAGEIGVKEDRCPKCCTTGCMSEYLTSGQAYWRSGCQIPKSPGIDWGIFGGESGRDARPCNVNDIRFGVQQFEQANIPVFVKQLGSKPIFSQTEGYATIIAGGIKHPKGGLPEEWPADLQDCREWPVVKGASDD